MKIEKVLAALERFAPLPLQEDYDNAGLQIGLTEAEVSGALLCLDVTEAVIDEALQKNCNLIVSHHPLLFRALKQISDKTEVQRVIIKAIRENIAIISMHTNLDNVRNGVNAKIAEKLRLDDCQLLGKQRMVDGIDGAAGIVGNLPQPVEAPEFIDLLKEAFAVPFVQANALLERKVSRVAVCGGAGAFLLDDALMAGADAFVTGEMRYHEFFGHDQQLQIAVIGHYESEQFTPEIFKRVLEDACPQLRCLISSTNTNPIVYR